MEKFVQRDYEASDIKKKLNKANTYLSNNYQ